MRLSYCFHFVCIALFPFLFGGTFIEADRRGSNGVWGGDFPFLFGGTFIEATDTAPQKIIKPPFPFLFGGTFIEARLSPYID